MGDMPQTQCAFVRLLSNPKVTSAAVSIADAFTALEHLVAHPRHIFWDDDITLMDRRFIDRTRLQGHGQITDAYLLGLCRRHGGQVATFDQGLAALATSSGQANSVLLIP
jgi:toxin-antitoxin system PIN domain toxin